MAGAGGKSPETPGSKAERDARLAKALRDNLRRRKAAPAAAPKPDKDRPKAV